MKSTHLSTIPPKMQGSGGVYIAASESSWLGAALGAERHLQPKGCVPSIHLEVDLQGPRVLGSEGFEGRVLSVSAVLPK